MIRPSPGLQGLVPWYLLGPLRRRLLGFLSGGTVPGLRVGYGAPSRALHTRGCWALSLERGVGNFLPCCFFPPCFCPPSKPVGARKVTGSCVLGPHRNAVLYVEGGDRQAPTTDSHTVTLLPTGESPAHPSVKTSQPRQDLLPSCCSFCPGKTPFPRGIL